MSYKSWGLETWIGFIELRSLMSSRLNTLVIAHFLRLVRLKWCQFCSDWEAVRVEMFLKRCRDAFLLFCNWKSWNDQFTMTVCDVGFAEQFVKPFNSCFTAGVCFRMLLRATSWCIDGVTSLFHIQLLLSAKLLFFFKLIPWECEHLEVFFFHIETS